MLSWRGGREVEKFLSASADERAGCGKAEGCLPQESARVEGRRDKPSRSKGLGWRSIVAVERLVSGC